MFFAQEVQQVPVAAPAAVPAPLPTLPPAPMLEPSFNFLQDSQVTTCTSCKLKTKLSQSLSKCILELTHFVICSSFKELFSRSI